MNLGRIVAGIIGSLPPTSADVSDSQPGFTLIDNFVAPKLTRVGRCLFQQPDVFETRFLKASCPPRSRPLLPRNALAV